MPSEWPSSRPPQSPPEILPPEDRSYTGPFPNASPNGGVDEYGRDPRFSPAPPRRTQGNRWATAPATYTLVGINCAVYVAMVFSGVSATNPSVQQLIGWGANFGGAVLAGEWWRLLTAAFVHVGILHLATNMWCLWNLGLLGEPLLGPAGVVAVYVLTGTAGNLLSTAVHPQVVGAGASGAVFGLAGVLILLLKTKFLPVAPEEVRRLRRSVIYFALLNFVIGGTSMFLRTSIQIDNMAHLGGFLCGLALGGPLVPRIGSARSQYTVRSWAAYAGMAVLLVVFARGIAQFYQP
jgi:rhomboid protease GluP